MSSQSTLENDDLFGEAAAEMRADVETHLQQAWAELPDSDEIWNTEADNVLGVLNGLRSGLDAGDAEEHLRQAKKWYTMGERADAFEDADDLVEEIQAVEEVIEMLEDAREQVGGLTSTMPQLRGALDEADEAREAREDATGDADEESEEDAAADDESETDEADEADEADEEDEE